jgi:hypothetical protein
MVVWIDSTSATESSWHDKKATIRDLETDSYPKALQCTTVGFLLWENQYAMTITHSQHETECGPYITIPKPAVIHRRTLMKAKTVRNIEEEHETTP